MRRSFVYAAKIERVIDGDTVDVELDLGMRVFFRTRLRIAGIDAPERNTDAGKAAKAFLQGLLPVGWAVTVSTYKPDKYGRALADIEFNDHDVGETMVGNGHARVYGPR